MKLHRILGSAALVVALACVQGGLAAQQAPAPGGAPAGGRQGGAPVGGRQGGGPPPAPQTGQSARLTDFTGYWVSVVNQDWFLRMITPPKGDYRQVPLNAAARKVADEFDPAQYGGDKYQTSGIVDCRAYGAAGVMHMPTRIHITWASANVLKIETDWGEQTRLLNFDPARLNGDVEMMMRTGEIGPTQAAPSMQGHSFAMWELPYRLNANQWQRGNAGRGGGGLTGSGGDLAQPGGNMAVLTTNLTPGWLRRNGVPYSARTRVIEHFLTFQDPTGANWINIVTEVNDPEYLNTQ